jgi:hypothetical protein
MHALRYSYLAAIAVTAMAWARWILCPSEEANHGQRRSLASKSLEEALGNRLRLSRVIEGNLIR